MLRLAFTFLCALLALQYASAGFLDKPECSPKYVRRIDRDMVKLFSLGKDGQNLPPDMEAMPAYCKEVEKLVNRIEKFFKTCYKKEVQDVANLFFFTAKNALKQYCKRAKSNRKLAKLLTITKCYNENLKDDTQCLDIFVGNTKSLMVQDDKIKIPHLCCDYFSMIDCYEKKMLALDCFKNGTAALLDFVRSLFANLVDVICGDFNEHTDKCDKLGPTPKAVKPARTSYKAVLFHVIELIASIK